MKNDWQMVPFHQIMSMVSRPVKVDQDKNYRILGMRWYGKGLFVRGEKRGNEIQAKELFRVEKNDFVYNRLFAWKGSFGIVDDISTGGYVSSEFPCFQVNKEIAIPEFIQWYLSQEPVWDIISRISSGQTNISRLRLKVPIFLRMKIPLPPINEQKRIVNRIQELSSIINEVILLRSSAADEVGTLIDATIRNFVMEYESVWDFDIIPKVAEINPSRKGQINLRKDDIVSFVPMSAVDEISGTITNPQPKTLDEVSKGYTWFINGDVVFAKITPCMQNGKSAIAQNLLNGTGFGSTEFHVIRSKGQVLPEWIHFLVRTKGFREDAADHFKGTAGQQRVPQVFLENKKIPIPPLHEQYRLVAYLESLQSKVSLFIKEQAEMEMQLAAFMPSILDTAFKGEL